MWISSVFNQRLDKILIRGSFHPVTIVGFFFSYFLGSVLLTFSLSAILCYILIVCVVLNFHLGKPFVLSFFAFSLRCTATGPDQQLCI